MNDRNPLDRLLTELGSATPDDGFEQRLLRGIARRQLTPMPHRTPRRRLAFGLASVLAVALACVGLSISTLERRHEESPVARRAAVLPSLAPAHAAPELRLAANLRPQLPATQRRNPPANPDLLVSFPAPPAPLTEQEELLLRVVRGHNPVEEAMLRADALPLEEARGREEFQRFFPPPDPPPNDIPPPQITDPRASPAPAAPTTSTTKDIQGDPK